MPELHSQKSLDPLLKPGTDLSQGVGEHRKGLPSERTGAQILAQPLAGGILFPGYNDASPVPFDQIWGNFTDFPGFPSFDAPANDGFGLQSQWNFFFTARAIWYRRIRAMRRDPTINLARILSIAPILSAGWSYEETDKAEKYPGVKEFIEREVEPFRLHLIQTGMLNCLDFGWQGYEKVFQYLDEDNAIHIKKLKPLLPDLTHIRVNQNTGEFIGLQQFQNFASIERNAIINLDLDESLLYYIDYEGTNWYGNSVMRIAEMPHRLSQIANNAAMRYDLKIAGSHWVVYYPIGRSPYGPAAIETDNFIIAQDLIRQLEQSGALAIPTLVSAIVNDLNSVGGEFAQEKRDWRVEILSDNSAGAQSFDPRLRYLDSLKFRAFGLPERSATEGQFGTKAESATQIDFALTHIMFRGDMFCQQTNEGLINQLLRYNYGVEAEGCVFVKQKPITDEAISRIFQVYMKGMDLPTLEPHLVSALDIEEMQKKIGIPVNPDYAAADSEDEPRVDEKHSLEDVMASINQDYAYSRLQAPGVEVENIDREALAKRINGEAYKGYKNRYTYVNPAEDASTVDTNPN